MRRFPLRSFLVSVVLCGALGTQGLHAKGLTVSPATYWWRGVRPGTTAEAPGPLKIANGSRGVRSYALRVIRPSEIGAEISENALELPSTRWIDLDRPHLVLNPEEVGWVTMLATVPSDAGAANPTWEFFIEVKEDPTRGERFALACYVRVLLSSAP